MKIVSAEFKISNTDINKCPKDKFPEYAFIGRSNVGKSSLINMLTNKNKLAKTSQKPGKTQLINHFIINKNWYLVDLPGYGWSKVSKSLRDSWGPMIETYLTKRETLNCVFVLMDIRIPPQKIDLDFILWLGENQIPFAIIFTKADKMTKNKIQSSVAAFKREILKIFEWMPGFFISSSVSSLGQKEILNYIQELNDAQ